MTNEQFIKAATIRKDIGNLENFIKEIKLSFICRFATGKYSAICFDNELKERLSKNEMMELEFRKQEIKRIICDSLESSLEYKKKIF